ncbi:MAG: DUF4910 domain-containing protein [Alphaproteobacteria bacterium]|nr:DUF4910 domain-containing protein [Alphaproteobacteria bacterium]
MLPSAAELHSLLKRLYPITRSLTGDGVRETLRVVQEVADLEIQEYPSGAQVYDWQIPREWNIRDAHISTLDGQRVVDFRRNGLHVVGYSVPVCEEMAFADLEPHLHTLPNLPDAIPYRTSYYRENWGFCLTQKQLEAMDRNARYHVVIDSTLEDGVLNFGEKLLRGTSGREFFLSTYCCHPWMANDNQSGVVLTAFLNRYLSQKEELHHSYRIVWVPETIGAISYLAHNELAMKNLEGGFVLSCCGGPGPLAYKETFLGDHLIDRAVKLAFRDAGIEPWLRPFAPDGSDERQYSMPAFRIPMCTIAKDKYYDYAYYHTSLDDPDFVTGENLLSTLKMYIDAIEILERNRVFKTTMPYCEPQLGKRGLYPQIGGAHNQFGNVKKCAMSIEAEVDALTWMMFLADGTMDMVDIAERSAQPYSNLCVAAVKLVENGLLEEIQEVNAR